MIYIAYSYKNTTRDLQPMNHENETCIRVTENKEKKKNSKLRKKRTQKKIDGWSCVRVIDP